MNDLILRIGNFWTRDEHRASNNDVMDEETVGALDIDENPSDDELFEVNLWDEDGEGSGFNQNRKLEMATSDVVESFVELHFPEDSVELNGLRSHVSHKYFDEVLLVLTKLGFAVIMSE